MANTFFTDDYAVLGFKAGQRIGNWLWFVDGRNLTNRKYAATTSVTRTQAGADGPQFYPGDGRSVYAGVQWQI